jgi:DNA-binding MarR family transcriptional regulator
MMADEEQDWAVYCCIAQNPGSHPKDLAEQVGIDAAAIEASLSRLERGLLVTETGGLYRVASIGESILRCRLRYERDLPLVYKDGVIRVRQDREE